jgi:hypothetical protein
MAESADTDTRALRCARCDARAAALPSITNAAAAAGVPPSQFGYRCQQPDRAKIAFARRACARRQPGSAIDVTPFLLCHARRKQIGRSAR